MDAIYNQNNPNRLKTRRDGDLTLSEQVKIAVKNYFEQLDGDPANGLYDLVMNQVEKPLIEAVLDQSNRNQTKTANALGISRSTLRKKINQYKIK